MFVTKEHLERTSKEKFICFIWRVALYEIYKLSHRLSNKGVNSALGQPMIYFTKGNGTMYYERIIGHAVCKEWGLYENDNSSLPDAVNEIFEKIYGKKCYIKIEYKISLAVDGNMEVNAEGECEDVYLEAALFEENKESEESSEGNSDGNKDMRFDKIVMEFTNDIRIEIPYFPFLTSSTLFITVIEREDRDVAIIDCKDIVVTICYCKEGDECECNI